MPSIPFALASDISGTRLMVGDIALSHACTHEAEVDFAVRELKSRLDAEAKRWKARIREEARKPMFPKVAS